MTITSLGASGEGVGSYQGLKIFVEGALPGEEVLIGLTELKKNYALASLRKILIPSLHRTIPVCPLFSECGGCQIMHLSYEQQLKAKRTKVVEAFHRIGHLSECTIEECAPSPLPLYYRNKIQLPLAWDQNTCKIGLYRKNSHDVIPLNKCFIQCEAGEKIFKTIAPWLTLKTIRYLLIKNAIHNNEALIVLVTDGQNPQELKTLAEKILSLLPEVKGVVENVNRGDTNVILTDHFRPLSGRPYIIEKLLGKSFKISGGAFFQVNTWQAEHLYTYALDLAELSANQTAIDAYCGVGTLTLFAADRAQSVIGIEAHPQAITDAKENARLNLQKNVTFFCGKAENLMMRFTKPDMIFLNPPRKGCERGLLQTICNKKIEKIVYISCDPATLARDLALLKEGGYRIDKVKPFDMFPQTMHVETVVRACRQ